MKPSPKRSLLWGSWCVHIGVNNLQLVFLIVLCFREDAAEAAALKLCEETSYGWPYKDGASILAWTVLTLYTAEPPGLLNYSGHLCGQDKITQSLQLTNDRH